ncbi:anthranilate synthase component I family protein [Paenibacillus sp. MMS18-CY102]|uniref:anthranilate synthase component I family protein n=1 Tax=Paenibacillus sp. MMS18-CY102 TaxID=2682849 RepID=UPI0013661720|nr:anthranilate synthase component I family protein [Paenibacillus sp. MMS18-CY102]MWC30197.1 anthranilate synthase component I family protein [Paenibacillus sp. MMS18-CY102]
MFTVWEQWQRWHAERAYTTLPVLHKLPLNGAGSKIASWKAAWQDADAYSFVFESGKGGRYTYLGLHPSSVIQGKLQSAQSMDWTGTALEPAEARRLAHTASWEGTPLDVVRRWMAPYRGPRVEAGPAWTGGCAGFWGYDVIRTIERLPEIASDDLGVPDYLFMRMDELWVIDLEEDALYCAAHTTIPEHAAERELEALYERAVQRVEAMAAYWHARFNDGLQPEATGLLTREARLSKLASESLTIDVESVADTFSPFAKEAYENAVRKIQQYIGQGDVFQVNLSLRQSKRTAVSPEELYEWLRVVNPSPYMGFLRCPEFQLVSGSPELLVELKDGILATRPIAGTRRRGRTPEEDLAMEQELLNTEKERAEHIMLVDLERNDLGRIASYGSVHVPELMVIERYSHVMHLVSQVEGKIAEGKDAFDVIAATFPGGTITGAPKIRTMEIIEELEPTRRGPYTGSMGWIDYCGNMEFNIIIRTMTVRDGVVHIQAGAGIVIDSIPEREYYESLSKAKALWKAIQLGERFENQPDVLTKHEDATDTGALSSRLL